MDLNEGNLTATATDAQENSATETGDSSQANAAGDQAAATAGTSADLIGETVSPANPANPAATSGGEETKGDAASEPDWFKDIPGEADGDKPALRDWLKSSGVKDVAGLAKMARDNQAALRESGRVKVPGEGAEESEVAEFRTAIGVPDDAKGYERPAPVDADGAPLPLNDAMLDRITAAAHKNGVPKAALEGLLKEEIEAQLAEANQLEADLVEQSKAHVKTWGNDANSKLEAVDNAMSALGLSKEDGLALRSALGPQKSLDMFARLGANMSEDRLTGSSAERRFGISAAEAQKNIDAKKNDADFRKALDVPNSPERAQWNRWQDAVGADADRKQRNGE